MDLSINEGTLVVTGGIGDSIEHAIAIKKTPRGVHILLQDRTERRLYFDVTDWLDRAQSHFDASR